MKICGAVFGLVTVAAMSAAVRGDDGEALQKRVRDFERSLLVKENNASQMKELPEEQQRPLVEAFFATLKNSEEKVAFLKVMYPDYPRFFSDHKVMGEFAAKLLKDDDANVRKAAIWGLSRNGMRQLSEEMPALLNDADEEVRINAARALGGFARHDAEPRMAEMAREGKSAAERVAGLTGIGMLVRDAAAPAEQHKKELAIITGYLSEQAAPEMQQIAVGFLTGVPESGEYLEAVLKLTAKGSVGIRRAGTKFLAFVPGDAATAALRGALKDPDSSVRSGAAQALGAVRAYCGNYGTIRPPAKETAGEVAALLKDDDEWVRIAALQALEAMGAKEYNEAVGALRTDKEERVRETAKKTLGTLSAGAKAVGH